MSDKNKAFLKKDAAIAEGNMKGSYLSVMRIRSGLLQETQFLKERSRQPIDGKM